MARCHKEWAALYLSLASREANTVLDGSPNATTSAGEAPQCADSGNDLILVDRAFDLDYAHNVLTHHADGYQMRLDLARDREGGLCVRFRQAHRFSCGITDPCSHKVGVLVYGYPLEHERDSPCRLEPILIACGPFGFCRGDRVLDPLKFGLRPQVPIRTPDAMDLFPVSTNGTDLRL